MQIGNVYQTTTDYTSTTPYEKAATQKEKATAQDVQTEKELVYQPKEETKDEKVTYEKPKKLTAEQITQLKEEREASKMEMLRKMAEANVKNQSGTATAATTTLDLLGKSGDDLLTAIFGSVEEAIPPMATTPEGAAADIAPGGAYSIEAVTERLMKMAKAIAGDNVDTLESMRGAVQEGFKQAGLDLDTGKGLPEICYDTYKATMEAFDSWKKELQGDTE